MSRQRVVLTAFIVTAIHFAASINLYRIAYKGIMGSFSGATPIAVWFISILWIALTLPAFWPIVLLAPRDSFPGYWGYLPMLGNSFLWGCGIAVVIHRRRSRMNEGSA